MRRAFGVRLAHSWPDVNESMISDWRRALLVGFAILVSLYSLSLPFLSTRLLVQHLTDDSSYYFLIADNFVRHYGFTFDRLTSTNGFQPLWQGVLIVLRFVFSLRPEGFVRVVVAMEALLMIAALCLFWKTVTRAAPGIAKWAGIMVFLAVVFLKVGTGMETSLIFLLFTCLIEKCTRDKPFEHFSRGERILLGTLLGAIILARLDSVFFAAAFLLTCCWPIRNSLAVKGRFLFTIEVGMVTTLIVVPYLLLNLHLFGHALPISGAIKSSFPIPGWFFPNFKLSLQGRIMFLVATGCSLAFLIWRWTRQQSDKTVFAPIITPLALGVLLHHAYSSFFMKWAVFDWHFVISRVFLPYAVVDLLMRQKRGIGSWLRTGTAGLLIVGSTVIVAGYVAHVFRRGDKSWRVTSYEAAVWARTHLPADSIIAMKDSGNLAYYSGLRVMNLDGVANNFAYQDELRRGNFGAYLHSHGVQYLAQHAFWDSPDINSGKYFDYTMSAYSHLYDCSGGSLRLFRKDEVYRSQEYFDGPHPTVLVIWKINWSKQVLSQNASSTLMTHCLASAVERKDNFRKPHAVCDLDEKNRSDKCTNRDAPEIVTPDRFHAVCQGFDGQSEGDSSRILAEVARVLEAGEAPRKVPEFWDGKASERIVSILRKIGGIG